MRKTFDNWSTQKTLTSNEMIECRCHRKNIKRERIVENLFELPASHQTFPHLHYTVVYTWLHKLKYRLHIAKFLLLNLIVNKIS